MRAARLLTPARSKIADTWISTVRSAIPRSIRRSPSRRDREVVQCRAAEERHAVAEGVAIAADGEPERRVARGRARQAGRLQIEVRDGERLRVAREHQRGVERRRRGDRSLGEAPGAARTDQQHHEPGHADRPRSRRRRAHPRNAVHGHSVCSRGPARRRADHEAEHRRRRDEGLGRAMVERCDARIDHRSRSGDGARSDRASSDGLWLRGRARNGRDEPRLRRDRVRHEGGGHDRLGARDPSRRRCGLRQRGDSLRAGRCLLDEPPRPRSLRSRGAARSPPRLSST